MSSAKPAVPVPPRRLTADLSLAGITFVWGATFVLVQDALRDLSVVLYLVLRFAIAGAALLVFARGLRVTRTLVAGGAAVGSTLFLGYLFQTWGLLYTTPSKCAFITGSAVIMVPILSGMVYRRFAGWGPVAGVAFATAGLYLLTMPGASGSMNRGDLLTLVAAFCYAWQVILIGHYASRIPPVGLAAGQVIAALVLALIALPWAEPVRFHLSTTAVAAVLITGLICTGLAFFVQSWAQQFTPPTYAVLIFSLEPVFASLTSWVLRGERLSTAGTAGAGLILAGIVIAETFHKSRRL